MSCPILGQLDDEQRQLIVDKMPDKECVQHLVHWTRPIDTNGMNREYEVNIFKSRYSTYMVGV
jgi:hypothetical protein